MIKYAKIVDQESGLCEVGLDTNIAVYQSMGMTQLDVKQSDINKAWYLADKCPMKTDEQKEFEEKEQIKNLSMTRGDVFEALILAKGLSKAQLRGMIEAYETDETTKLLYLNRFDEALDFYRGYPIFDLLGEQIGITPTMWDEFFETKDWNKLVKIEESENGEVEE